MARKPAMKAGDGKGGKPGFGAGGDKGKGNNPDILTRTREDSPDPEGVMELVGEGKTITSIAKHFKCSRNAIYSVKSAYPDRWAIERAKGDDALTEKAIDILDVLMVGADEDRDKIHASRSLLQAKSYGGFGKQQVELSGSVSFNPSLLPVRRK